MANQRLIALCILGAVLFNYPILSLLSGRGVVGGIPTLYAYIFAAWAALIVLLALAARTPPTPPKR